MRDALSASYLPHLLRLKVHLRPKSYGNEFVRPVHPQTARRRPHLPYHTRAAIVGARNRCPNFRGTARASSVFTPSAPKKHTSPPRPPAHLVERVREACSRPVNHLALRCYARRDRPRAHSPDMHLHTATSFSAVGSQTASRIGLHHCTFRPLPCHAPMGTRSRLSPSPTT